MEDDTEYLKLPIEDRCVHKLWKARLNGYEEAVKLFNKIDDEKSQEWSKFLGLVKKFVVDSNAAAQEKGLEATLAFVENCGSAGKTVGDVVGGIVEKCIAAPKTKTKQLSIQIILMYIEIEKQDAVQEELLKGFGHKNPKIVSACIAAMTQGLKEFGHKVVNVKPLVKKIPALLEDRDKTVRDEGKAMVVEIFRWIGAALKPQIASLRQASELEAEFEKLKNDKVIPTRYLRSQQAKQAQAAAVAENGGGDGDDDEEEEPVEIDPYEIMAPVDILSKLPAGFYEKLEAKKWQERKEAVDALETLLQSAPKLENGDYGDLVRALKKIITKDSNVMVVAVAGKCLAGLANGLKRRFQPYASACIPALLEKFREKKSNVVAALREAVDAIFPSTTLDNIQEDVLAALDNKNPSVKAETAAFLARCFCKCTPTMLNKKILKAYSGALIKALNDPDLVVRDNAAEALGAALKVVGEKVLMPFVNEVDNLKMTKIRECCEKAVITAKPVKAPRAERPNTAPAPAQPTTAGSSVPKPVKRPATGGAAVRKPVANPAKKPTAAKVGKESKNQEKDLSQEEVDEKASDIFPPNMLSGLGDAAWKTRLASVEEFAQIVRGLDATDAPTQVLMRVLQKKPGLKDTNFQVLKARLEAVKLIAENYPVSTVTVAYVLNDVVEKLGDAKNGSIACEVLTALSEATKLDFVATEVVDFAMNNQKSPKVQQETLNWLSEALLQFGFVVQPKALLENLKKGVAATNPAVRSASIQLIGTMYLFMGSQIGLFFENEKPALVQQINAEFEKREGEKPPAPTRGASTKPSKDDDGNTNEDDEAEKACGFDMNDIVPRVDIGPQLNDTLISELSDKDWKVRNEALCKLTTILSEARFILPNLGELPPVLAQRLTDSNAKIAATAVSICQTLATALGSACKQYTRIFFPGLLHCMGDSKGWIRLSAVTCVNTYGDLGGFKEFFEGEVIADSLKAGSPLLRNELWNWLAEKLPSIKSVSKEELKACLPHLYSNLEDRSPDIRKSAQEATLGFMIHLGHQEMTRATANLKPGSRTVIAAHIDKVRANLPSPPPPRPKGRAIAHSASDDQLATKAGVNPPSKNASAGSKTITKSKRGAPVKPTSRKKEEEVDTSPLVQVNGLKNQRYIDEQKLKVLKWNFNTPREEFVELLKDQMMTANFNKNLFASMFHTDFKFHLRAIDMLLEDLPENGKALTCNLDLILKWMTLRFFDTNPSVLLKGLEYLQTVFNMLIEDNYSMLETEASSFIPYLILKVGDPKDAVRNSVHALFKQIGKVYSVNKLFTYIMEGLKSKNARQRTECLDELGYLIETYGISVCQPSAAAAMKEVAKQISDRDNAVRNAALNCVVQAYFLEGEKVYKMVGQISDKDMSLLEERIKRAARNKPPPRATASNVRPANAENSPPSKKASSEPTYTIPSRFQREPSNNDLLEEKTQEQPTVLACPSKQQMSGPYQLDMDLLEKLENFDSKPKREVVKVDLTGILDEPEHNKFNTYKENKNKLVNVLNIQNSSGLPAQNVLKDYKPPQKSYNQADEVVDRVMDNLVCTDLVKCCDALVNLEYLIRSDRMCYLVPRIEQFMKSCITQVTTVLLYDNVFSKEERTLFAKTFLACLHSFYNEPKLSRLVSTTDLREIFRIMIQLLTTPHCLDSLEKTQHDYVHVINVLVMVIIEKSDHTRVTCALLKLLHESVEREGQWPAKMQELFMKCIWKVVRCFESWEPDIDYDPIFYEIHLFLKAYPSRKWKQSQSDVPLRTVKTVIHAMVKQRGSQVLNHLSRINEPSESELIVYLNKFIQLMKPEDQKAMKTQSQQRLSKDAQDVLAEIFTKIGSKEHSKEGLNLLYDFKLQHADASLEPFLSKSSQFFQDYVQRGLKSIEFERKRQEPKPSTTLTTNSSNSNEIVNSTDCESNEAMYYLQRLRSFQIRAGHLPAGNPQGTPVTVDAQLDLDQNLNFSAGSGSKQASPPKRNENSPPHDTNTQAIRRRLEELKNSLR